MGVLKRLTEEYFGETERKEDMIEVPNFVERADFTDTNGKRHRNGYRVNFGDDMVDRTILRDLISRLIKKRGPECDLNDIDVSGIVDMGYIFGGMTIDENTNRLFNGDISGWDVSNVKVMNHMFSNSRFNGDISKWKVTKVLNMDYMFFNSKFDGSNGDISGWDVNPDCDMTDMFDNSPLMNNPPEWYNENR
jgi:hypothetical protein